MSRMLCLSKVMHRTWQRTTPGYLICCGAICALYRLKINESFISIFWCHLACCWTELFESNFQVSLESKDCSNFIRVFPNFKQFACFHFEFPLADDDVSLYSYCLPGLLWFCFFPHAIENCSLKSAI